MRMLQLCHIPHQCLAFAPLLPAAHEQRAGLRQGVDSVQRPDRLGGHHLLRLVRIQVRVICVQLGLSSTPAYLAAPMCYVLIFPPPLPPPLLQGL